MCWGPWFHLHHRKSARCASEWLASQNQGISSWRVKRISPKNKYINYYLYCVECGQTFWLINLNPWSCWIPFPPRINESLLAMPELIPANSDLQILLAFLGQFCRFLNNLRLLRSLTISSCLLSSPSILAPIPRTLIFLMNKLLQLIEMLFQIFHLCFQLTSVLAHSVTFTWLRGLCCQLLPPRLLNFKSHPPKNS